MVFTHIEPGHLLSFSTIGFAILIGTYTFIFLRPFPVEDSAYFRKAAIKIIKASQFSSFLLIIAAVILINSCLFTSRANFCDGLITSGVYIIIVAVNLILLLAIFQIGNASKLWFDDLKESIKITREYSRRNVDPRS